MEQRVWTFYFYQVHTNDGTDHPQLCILVQGGPEFPTQKYLLATQEPVGKSPCIIQGDPSLADGV